MTQRRGRKSIVVAGLAAVVVGAATAGTATMITAAKTATESGTRISADFALPAPPTKPEPRTAASGSGGTGAGGAAAPATTTTTTEPAPTTTTETSTPAPPPETTTPAKKSAPKPPPPTDGTAADQVVAITNQERAANGCAPLTTDARLVQAAVGHSTDMANRDYFSHTSPEGKTFVDRANAAGYDSPGAENIAKGQRTPAEVMEAWMNSSGHRANILNCKLKTIGVGLVTDGYYWTQIFGY